MLKNLIPNSVWQTAILCLVSIYLPINSYASQIRIAVASNFLAPIKSISKDYQKQTGNQLLISSGSTGKLYAQIVNGAPFDIFLAANSREPKQLESIGKVVKGSRFTYALGKLALWSPQFGSGKTEIKEILSNKNIKRISIANPKIAPYGAAAIEVIKNLGVYETLKSKIIRGENVNQAYQYIESGAAQLGFVALSQLKIQHNSLAPQRPSINEHTKQYRQVDQSLYTPIRQQAVLLKTKFDNLAARQFLDYLKSPDGRAVIESFGYGVEK